MNEPQAVYLHTIPTAYMYGAPYGVAAQALFSNFRAFAERYCDGKEGHFGFSAKVPLRDSLHRGTAVLDAVLLYLPAASPGERGQHSWLLPGFFTSSSLARRRGRADPQGRGAGCAGCDAHGRAAHGAHGNADGAEEDDRG